MPHPLLVCMHKYQEVESNVHTLNYHMDFTCNMQYYFPNVQLLHQAVIIIDQSLTYVFGGHNLCCRTTSTPVLDLRWPRSWVSKPWCIQLHTYFLAFTWWIHLWCNTCWPFGDQYGDQAPLAPYFYNQWLELNLWVSVVDRRCNQLSHWGLAVLNWWLGNTIFF